MTPKYKYINTTLCQLNNYKIVNMALYRSTELKDRLEYMCIFLSGIYYVVSIYIPKQFTHFFNLL